MARFASAAAETQHDKVLKISNESIRRNTESKTNGNTRQNRAIQEQEDRNFAKHRRPAAHCSWESSGQVESPKKGRTIQTKALFLPKCTCKDALADDVLDQILRIRSMDRFYSQVSFVSHLDNWYQTASNSEDVKGEGWASRQLRLAHRHRLLVGPVELSLRFSPLRAHQYYESCLLGSQSLPSVWLSTTLFHSSIMYSALGKSFLSNVISSCNGTIFAPSSFWSPSLSSLIFDCLSILIFW